MAALPSPGKTQVLQTAGSGALCVRSDLAVSSASTSVDLGGRRSGAEVAGRRRGGLLRDGGLQALFRREARKSWPHTGRAFPLGASARNEDDQALAGW
jgi:hypothetical protein